MSASTAIGYVGRIVRRTVPSERGIPLHRRSGLFLRVGSVRRFQGFGGNGFGSAFPGGAGQRHTEYYDLLDVSPDASEDEIKKSFRKKAMEHHPDRGGDIEKFKEIKAAYETLSDEKKRQQYDQFGPEGVQDDNMGGNQGAGNPFSEDIFSQFFGGGAQQRTVRKTDTIHTRAELTLEEIFGGTTKDLHFMKQVICDSCDGLGATSKKGIKHCHVCNGTGVVTQTRQMGPFMQQVQSECTACGGQGKTISSEYKCGTCDGKKVVKKKKVLEVKIKAGVKHGTKLFLRGQADQHPDMEPGDIVLTVLQKKHDLFTCTGSDLVYKHKLTLAEALTGFKFPLNNVDGSTLVLESSDGEVISPGALKVVPGAGMPKSSGGGSARGDLYLMFDVVMPESVTSEVAEKLSELLPKPETNHLPEDGIPTSPKHAGRVPFKLDLDETDEGDFGSDEANSSNCRQM